MKSDNTSEKHHPLLLRSLGIFAEDPRPNREITRTAGVGRMTINNWQNQGDALLSSVAAMLDACGYEIEIRRKPRV